MTVAKRSKESPGRHLWPRLRGALLAAPRAIHLLLLLICLALGFALVAQVRAQREDPLEALDQEGLVEVLNELDSREQILTEERSDLQSQLTQLENEATQQEAAEEAARKAREVAQINAGTVAVEGPGIVMTVVDEAQALSATHFVMTLGELRNAGAEAVELNGVRLTMRSAFVSDDSGISVDGVPISSPYRWKVIGDSQTIATALEIRAGSAAQMRAKDATVDITVHDDVLIEAVAEPFTPQWATPS